MKKAVAIPLALALALTLFACGKAPAPTTATQATTAAASTVLPAIEAIEESAAATQVADATGTAEESASVAGSTTQIATTQPGAPFALNSSDIAQVLALYQAIARQNPNLRTQDSASLNGVIKGENGQEGTFAKIARPIFASAIEKSGTTENTFPGAPAQLTVGDVTSAEAKTANGKTTLTLHIKEQNAKKDTPKFEGSVGRGFGLLAGDALLGNLGGGGVSVDESKATVDLAYKNPVILLTADSATGKVITAQWTNQVTITAKNLNVKILVFPAKEFPRMELTIDYSAKTI
ncbi:MAG: hypothetical protein LBS96_08420 [Oscillospiraceae bacterium]|nr:hypothetical protein [Oscillospiraceae bacterium]